MGLAIRWGDPDQSHEIAGWEAGAFAQRSTLGCHSAIDAAGRWFLVKELHGEFPFWQTVRQVFQSYQTLGQPGQEAFQVRVNERRAALVVCTGEEEVCLRDLY